MDLSVRALTFIILICLFILLVSDIERIENSKENQYQAVRAANQNSLIQLQQSGIASEEEMLERWIKNYCLSTDNTLDSVEIVFNVINSDPPCYVVSIKGTEKYAFVSRQLYTSFTSAATIVKKTENPID